MSVPGATVDWTTAGNSALPGYPGGVRYLESCDLAEQTDASQTGNQVEVVVVAVGSLDSSPGGP